MMTSWEAIFFPPNSPKQNAYLFDTTEKLPALDASKICLISTKYLQFFFLLAVNESFYVLAQI